MKQLERSKLTVQNKHIAQVKLFDSWLKSHANIIQKTKQNKTHKRRRFEVVWWILEWTDQIEHMTELLGPCQCIITTVHSFAFA